MELGFTKPPTPPPQVAWVRNGPGTGGSRDGVATGCSRNHRHLMGKAMVSGGIRTPLRQPKRDPVRRDHSDLAPAVGEELLFFRGHV